MEPSAAEKLVQMVIIGILMYLSYQFGEYLANVELNKAIELCEENLPRDKYCEYVITARVVE